MRGRSGGRRMCGPIKSIASSVGKTEEKEGGGRKAVSPLLHPRHPKERTKRAKVVKTLLFLPPSANVGPTNERSRKRRRKRRVHFRPSFSPPVLLCFFSSMPLENSPSKIVLAPPPPLTHNRIYFKKMLTSILKGEKVVVVVVPFPFLLSIGTDILGWRSL